MPLEAATALFATGLLRGEGSAAVQLLPPLPWFAVVIAGALVGAPRRRPRGSPPSSAAALLYLAVFGQWQSAMVTLASIVVAVPLGVAGGLLLGIAAYRRPAFERALAPDPRRHADRAGLRLSPADPLPLRLRPGRRRSIATVIYAMPPMVRVTLLALRGVPPEIVEFGRMTGAPRAS